jgi:hypothetical protein
MSRVAQTFLESNALDFSAPENMQEHRLLQRMIASPGFLAMIWLKAIYPCLEDLQPRWLDADSTWLPGVQKRGMFTRLPRLWEAMRAYATANGVLGSDLPGLFVTELNEMPKMSVIIKPQERNTSQTFARALRTGARPRTPRERARQSRDAETSATNDQLNPPSTWAPPRDRGARPPGRVLLQQQQASPAEDEKARKRSAPYLSTLLATHRPSKRRRTAQRTSEATRRRSRVEIKTKLKTGDNQNSPGDSRSSQSQSPYQSRTSVKGPVNKTKPPTSGFVWDPPLDEMWIRMRGIERERAASENRRGQGLVTGNADRMKDEPRHLLGWG